MRSEWALLACAVGHVGTVLLTLAGWRAVFGGCLWDALVWFVVAGVAGAIVRGATKGG